jgi:uncharacterized protein (TIGR01244 family)
MRNKIPVLIMLVGTALFLGATPDQLPNLQHPRYHIVTAGQPTEEGFQQLSASGVKSVINVLPDKECLTNEADTVAANDMVYYRFPFQIDDFNRATFEEFGVLLEQAQKPVLIHCSTGNHVGGLWFGYRYLVERAPLPVALLEARQIGMKPALEDSLLPWLLKQRPITASEAIPASR